MVYSGASGQGRCRTSSTCKVYVCVCVRVRGGEPFFFGFLRASGSYQTGNAMHLFIFFLICVAKVRHLASTNVLPGTLQMFLAKFLYFGAVVRKLIYTTV